MRGSPSDRVVSYLIEYPPPFARAEVDMAPLLLLLELLGSCPATLLLAPFTLALRGLQLHPALATSLLPCDATLRGLPRGAIRAPSHLHTHPSAPLPCISILSTSAPILCTLLASVPAPPSCLLFLIGSGARPSYMPALEAFGVSSTQKSSFAEFYVSLLKQLWALTPTRGCATQLVRADFTPAPRSQM